jgi:hypothetical protein
VIRNVILHLVNEQPLHADLLGRPDPGDVSLICTNIRLTNGRRPAFVNDSEAIFIFPYRQVRFVEIPATVAGDSTWDESVREGAPVASETQVLALAGPESWVSEPELDADLGLDEDLLRRVREL